MTDTATPTTETSQAPETPTATDTTTETSTQNSTAGTDLGTETSVTSETSATDLGTEDNSSETTEEGSAQPLAEDPFAELRGIPESGNYEAFSLPGGAEADPVLNEAFLPLAKELGLSQSGAQKIVDFKAKIDQHQLEQWGNHLTELKNSAKADAEIGGANYDKSIGLGRSVIAKFGTPKLREALNQYGIGAHPEMIRFLAKIGKAVGESPSIESKGGGVATEKPLHERMYRTSPGGN